MKNPHNFYCFLIYFEVHLMTEKVLSNRIKINQSIRLPIRLLELFDWLEYRNSKVSGLAMRSQRDHSKCKKCQPKRVGIFVFRRTRLKLAFVSGCVKAQTRCDSTEHFAFAALSEPGKSAANPSGIKVKKNAIIYLCFFRLVVTLD